jgi:hypothetical protein
MKKPQLKKAYPLLEIFSRLSESDQVELLKHMNCEHLDAICECIHNVLRNPAISEEERKQLFKRGLKPHLSNLRAINSLKTKRGVKIKKLFEVGPCIGLIVTTVLPILQSNLGKEK